MQARTVPGICSSIIRQMRADRAQIKKEPSARTRPALPSNIGAPLPANHSFAGRFTVIDGEETSGMSRVFPARDNISGREVMVKTTNYPDLEHFFATESAILRRGLHPMFPRLVESGRENGQTYLVMERIEGVELRALMDGRQIPLHQAIEITRSVLYGLSALHQAGQVHRDIKPANIMVEENGTVRLIDFGLACPVNYSEDAGRNSIVGTPTYVSPEQARLQPIRPASDLYSLGLVLFEMIRGENPMRGRDPLDSISNHAGDRQLPKIRGADLTVGYRPGSRETITPLLERARQELNGIIRGMTDKNIESRFQNAEEALARLEQLGAIAEQLRPFES